MTRDRRSIIGPRFAVPLLVLALLAAACGSDGNGNGTDEGAGAPRAVLPECPLAALDEAAGAVEVVVWHSYVGKTKETLETLAAEYTGSQDRVQVRVESQGNNYDELWDKYLQSIGTNELPGIAILEDTNTRAVVDSETVLPAQSCIDAEDYDTSDLVERTVDYYSIDGALYPGTLNVSAPLLYYNKNHFRRADLDPESTPQTLDEVREQAQQIKDAGVVDRPVIMHMSSWYLETWLTGSGEPVVNNDNGRGDGETTESALDSDATIELVTWVKEMVDDGLLTALPYRPGQIDHYLALAEQNASMTIETSTAATTIVAFLEGDTSIVQEVDEDLDAGDVDLNALDIGAGPVPGVDEAGQVQIGGGAWYITSTGAPEVQAAAWDFLKWWNQPEIQVRWHLDGSYMPFSKTAADDPRVEEEWTTTSSGQWLAIAYRELVDGVDPDWPGPLIGPYEQVRRALEQGLDQVLLRGTSPEDMVSGAASEATSAIQLYNQETF
jgi:sn-glycerol 3-phosphate transport system substrate-binding protein